MLFKDVYLVLGTEGKIYVISVETKWESLEERSSYDQKATHKGVLIS